MRRDSVARSLPTMAACCLLLATLLLSTARAAGLDASNQGVRLASWNVLWSALDDEYGRAAIVDTIDSAGPLDFFAVIEAAGDTPAGSFPAWTKASRALTALTPLATHTRHETLALFYNTSIWHPTYHSSGYFDLGRPWLIAHFASAGASLWVVAVHLPHFLDTASNPGAILADALTNASAATGEPTTNVVLAGDWNEFQWEDNNCRKPFYQPDCRVQARKRMARLWDSYFGGRARDVVPNHTITCCTKWGPERTSKSYPTWRFEVRAPPPPPPPRRHAHAWIA